MQTKVQKNFQFSKILLLNIGHELTYHYNGCQNAKNRYIILTNHGNQEKTYISYEFIYMYVKIASRWPQN